MFGRWAETLSRPKKKHSLENFKYLYQQLIKYPVIDESNQQLIIETLRSIAELLIWGDQNETRFFDFFFEKNIHSFFLKILNQKTSSTITVQLLQTLSILFENIQTETSIYYLLSNNYVNQIICHKFDFSDEEILAYYISFLKTLSLKLNKNTIHFFYNEHLNDFPLYTEAIKFFNHEESMIRVAVRTLTLNVFRVPDERMLRFVLDRTAVPYFSNLVWFISDQSISLNEHIRKHGGSMSPAELSKLKDMVAEHLDNLYYLNDILCLKVHAINEVLTAQVIKKLLVPLYLHSLIPVYALELNDQEAQKTEARLTPAVALFLLSHVLSIFTHRPIISTLVQLLVEPTPKTYAALMDEFTHDLSEVCISIHAEAPPPLPPSTAGKGRRTRADSKPADEARNPAAANGPGSVQVEPLSALGSSFSLTPRAADAPPDSPISGTPRPSSASTRTHSRSSSNASSVRQRLGPPAGPDGRVLGATTDPFLFTPKPLRLADEMLVRLAHVAGVEPAADATGALNRNLNVFRLALIDYLDTATSDTLALPAVCLLNLIVTNPVVPKEILLEGALSPRRLVKRKALLAALTTGADGSAGDAGAVPSAPPDKELPAAPAASAPGEPTPAAAAAPADATEASGGGAAAADALEPPTATAAADDGAIAAADTSRAGAESSSEATTPVQGTVVLPVAAPVAGPVPGQVLRQVSTSGPSGPRILPVPLFTTTDGAAADATAASDTGTLGRRPRSSSTVPSMGADASAKDDSSSSSGSLDMAVVDRLLAHLMPGFAGSRSVTLSVAMATLLELVRAPGEPPVLLPRHYDQFYQVEDASKAQLLRYLNNAPDVFLDMFEETARTAQVEVDVNRLVMDSSVLLPPSQTPMSGIDLARRLPCGEAEKVRKAVQDFWLLRRLRASLLQLPGDEEPLLEPPVPILPHDVLDLPSLPVGGTRADNSDMIRCTVVDKDGYRFTRFLVVDAFRLVQVEPDPSRTGWGIVRQVSPLQHTVAEYDKLNPSALDVTVAVTAAGSGSTRRGTAAPAWSAKMLFDDHVTCMTAKQHIDKGRQSLRARKLERIRALLTASGPDSPTQLEGAAAPTEAADRPEPPRLLRTATPLPAQPSGVAASSNAAAAGGDAA